MYVASSECFIVGALVHFVGLCVAPAELDLLLVLKDVLLNGFEPSLADAVDNFPGRSCDLRRRSPRGARCTAKQDLCLHAERHSGDSRSQRVDGVARLRVNEFVARLFPAPLHPSSVAVLLRIRNIALLAMWALREFTQVPDRFQMVDELFLCHTREAVVRRAPMLLTLSRHRFVVLDLVERDVRYCCWRLRETVLLLAAVPSLGKVQLQSCFPSLRARKRLHHGNGASERGSRRKSRSECGARANTKWLRVIHATHNNHLKHIKQIKLNTS